MPFLSGFSKRKAIRYGSVFPGSNLTDFPKLISITADAQIAAALASGGGIALADSDGTTQVPFGLYPGTSLSAGTILLRAKWPTLLTAASTGDVFGYLYYDAGQSTTENKAGVVSNNYALFMPMEEDPSGSSPQMRDWVTDTLVGTSNGSMTSGDLVSAQVGNGLDFDGSNDYVNCGHGSNLDAPSSTGQVTLEAWVKKATAAQNGQVVGKWLSGGFPGSNSYVLYNGQDAGNQKFSFYVEESDNSLIHFPFSSNVDTALHYIAATADGSNLRGYVDGASDGSPVSYDGTIHSQASRDVRVGIIEFAGFYPFSGIIDEVRISSVARSASWLAYAYNDDFNNANTFSLGSEETESSAVLLPFVTNKRANKQALIGGRAL